MAKRPFRQLKLQACSGPSGQQCTLETSTVSTPSSTRELDAPRSPKRGRFGSDSSTQYPSDSDSHNESDNEVSGESISTCTESTSSESRACVSDIAAGPHQEPVQPLHISYPIRKIGKSNRAFNPQWFKTYCWIEYSVQKDAIFCYPCCHFSTGSGRSEKTFTHTGFHDWKHALGRHGILPSHDKCSSHKQAMAAWKQYQSNVRHQTSVADQLGLARSQQIVKNRHYLKTIAEIILFCSHQEISLRGHNEGKESSNKGNFLEMLQLIARHDDNIQKQILLGPKNATYTSPETQNTILQIGDMVRSNIANAVQEVGYFSILADETKDISKKEQLAVVVRYVSLETANIHERFLTYVEATSLTAESLASYILETLKKYQLDAKLMVSQGYDGASVMSGRCSGVQMRIKEHAPHAIYIHCHAHVLNLVLVDSVKAIPEAAEFFALLEALYIFMSTSKAHTVFLAKQKDVYPGKQPRELKRLSDTRWACRHDAINAVAYTFEALVSALEDIANGSDKSKGIEAMGLLLQVKSFKFLLSLIVFDRILTCTKGLSDHLQNPRLDLTRAGDLVLGTISTLEEFRSDKTWDHVYDYVQQVARHLRIDIAPPLARQRKAPRRLEDYVVLESTSTGSREELSTSQEYKVHFYYCVIDTFLSELKSRFTQQNITLMRGIQACFPQSETFLDPEKLKPIVDFYGLDQETVITEAKIAKHTLMNGKYEMEHIRDVIHELVPLKDAFPNVMKLLVIASTIAVCTATCERSFSALKRIKTYLRSTMSEQRLNDLAVLSIERDFSSQLSLERVVDKFADLDKNRRIVLS